MRGEDERSEDLFSFVRLEQRVPADHPLRAIRALVDEALGQLSRSFARLYARDGRPSIPPDLPPDPGGVGGRPKQAAIFGGDRRRNDPGTRGRTQKAPFLRKGRGKGPTPRRRGKICTENRPGLIVAARLSEASGTAERTT